MIENLLKPEDYFEAGRELLDFAWGTVFDLLTDLDQADDWGYDKAEVSESYWTAAKRRLTTSLAVTQQGVELLLKGKISSISPYLLIGDSPSKWPSPYEGKPIDFGLFRTHDAQDLLRIYDTFGSAPLSKEFVEQFHSQRERRNIIIHSTSKELAIQVTEVVEAVLFAHKELFPDESWLGIRKAFLETGPDAELGSGDYSTNRICWETRIAVEHLSPAKVERYFRFDKKQRRYLCPECLDDANRDDDFTIKLAVLWPKDNGSTSLYCPICNKSHEIARVACGDTECPGNVMNFDGICLTCGH